MPVPFIDLKVGVLLLLLALWTFGYHSKQRIMYEVPLLALHLPKSHTEAIACILQFITYAAVEKGMENKGKFWKNRDTSTGGAAVDKKAHLGMKRHWTVQIRPVALVVIKLCFFEGISK